LSFKFASTIIDVSPPKGIPLSGLIKRAPRGEFCGIEECNIRIAWLTTSVGDDLIFVLADYLFFPNQLAKLTTDFMLSNFGIKAAQIIFAGTHTHSGPALGFLPWESEQPAYIKSVFEQLKKSIAALSERRKPCKLSSGIFNVEKININRRKPVVHWRRGFKKSAFMLPYDDGPVNPKVKVLAFEEEDGKKTLLVTYASHPVFNRNLKLSSDYPGLLSKRILDKGWADQVFVFQGFNGDVRPNYQGRPALKDKIRAMFYGPDFAEYKAEHLDDFVNVMVEGFAKIKFKSINIDELTFKEEVIDLNSSSGRSSQELRLRLIELGGALQFLTANAEMFVAYEIGLPMNVFPIGCTDQNIGYVPQASDLPLKGYEVSEAPLNNEMDGEICAEDLEGVEALIRDLASFSNSKLS